MSNVHDLIQVAMRRVGNHAFPDARDIDGHPIEEALGPFLAVELVFEMLGDACEGRLEARVVVGEYVRQDHEVIVARHACDRLFTPELPVVVLDGFNPFASLRSHPSPTARRGLLKTAPLIAPGWCGVSGEQSNRRPSFLTIEAGKLEDLIVLTEDRRGAESAYTAPAGRAPRC